MTPEQRGDGLSLPRLIAILVLTFLAAAAGASAADGASRHVRTCVPRSGQRVVQRSSAAVLLTRSSQDLVGCARSTGRRRTLWRSRGIPDEEVESLTAVELVGTRVLFTTSWHSHLADSDDRLILDDATKQRRRALVDRVTYGAGEPAAFPVAELRRDGAVAWVRRARGVDQLRLRDPRGATRDVDRGFTISAVTFTPKELRWQHGEQPRAASLGVPDACDPALTGGTLDADVGTQAGITRVCWRATGQTTALSDAAHTDIAGRLAVSVVGGTRIAVVDIPSGSTASIDAPGAEDPVVDEHGSVAWTTQTASSPLPRRELWIHDAAGSRRVASASRFGWYAFDDGVLRWVEGGELTPHQLVLQQP